MSIVDSFTTLDSKRNHETILAKPDPNDHFHIPKISSSLSFNNLAKVKTRKRTRSPQPQEKSQDLSMQYQYPASQQITSKYKQPTNAPKVSKKLPPAFGTIFQKSSSKLVAKKPSFEVSKDASEPFQAIEQLVGMQEYKQTVGLLSPLKPKSNTRNQADELPKPVNKKTDGKRPDSKRHKNPLLPLKNYLLLTKYSEDKKDLSNISVDRLERLYKASKDVNHPALSGPKKETMLRELKSNEMITLSVIRSSHETGTVKKVLHAPTMRLFAVKEVPLSNRETRINLKDWLSIWQSNFENSKNHIKIHSTSFNSPEGCISIFMELLNGGSLHNLLESMGNIPESSIRVIASQVLSALDDLHTKANTVYGALSPSQILIDKDGNIKLSLGLANRIQNANNHTGTLSRNFCEKTALYELTPINNPGSYQKHLTGMKDIDKNLMFSQDVFEFGYLMLLCAVGGLDFYEPDEFHNKLKLFFEELNKKPQERSKYCCVIHNEETISSIKNFEESLFTNKPVRVSKGNNGIIIDNKATKNSSTINIQDFLNQNFSKEFVKFLCSCLKFDPNERPTIKSLLSSPFIKSQEIRGPAITLAELLKISIQWNKNLVLPLEYQGPSERQLQKVCEALSVVLPNCESFSKGANPYEDLRDLNVSSPVIQNLSYELGLPAVKVWEEISKLLESLLEE